jgi:DNA topoisomerase-1
LNGRYGPYITDGEKNARIPKDKEPKELTAEECAALLAAAPNRPKRGGRFGKAAAKTAKKESAADAKPAKKATARKAPAKRAPKKPAVRKTPSAKKTAGTRLGSA